MDALLVNTAEPWIFQVKLPDVEPRMSDATFAVAALITVVAFLIMQLTVKSWEEQKRLRLWTNDLVGLSEGLLGFDWMGYFWIIQNGE